MQPFSSELVLLIWIINRWLIFSYKEFRTKSSYSVIEKTQPVKLQMYKMSQIESLYGEDDSIHRCKHLRFGQHITFETGPSIVLFKRNKSDVLCMNKSLYYFKVTVLCFNITNEWRKIMSGSNVSQRTGTVELKLGELPWSLNS